VTSLRTWAQAGPDTAEGIARAVIDFAEQRSAPNQTPWVTIGDQPVDPAQGAI
jgi:hypothetical protein